MKLIRAAASLRHMRPSRLRLMAATLVLVGSMVAAASSATADDRPSFTRPFRNSSGFARTFSAINISDPGKHPFFQSLGTNGRACVTCHQPAQGWSITPAHVRQRFIATSGLDPLFRTVDASNSPHAGVSTVQARLAAYSMLIRKGVFRIGLPIPAGAEFTLVAVDDPYRFASSGELSLFRRPLPATNLRFLSNVMWDGRETTTGQTVYSSLLHQANAATMGHAEARQPLTALQRTLIVDFTRRLYTTQVFDVSAGYLSEQGALGNPETLSRQPFFLGINDPDGGNPTKAPFNPAVFTIFNAWTSLNDLSTHTPARRAVARGQAIFNTRQFTISGVGGLNDVKGGPIQGTCSSCHNSPNAGNRSVATSLNIGVADGIRRTPDMPLYTLRCTATGKIVHTTDPGRALVTGKCADIGKFKVPGLRGIAARAPYFHDGSAATLRQVVDRYNQRFSIGLAPKEVADLVVFLRSQ